MRYCDFVAEVRNRIEKRVSDENKTVEVNQVVKTNDIELDGLIIRDIEFPNKPVPIFYLNHYFNLIKEGTRVDEIVDMIINSYQSSNGETVEPLIDFKNFDSMRDKINLRVINTANNKKYIEGLPHVDILDLSIVFVCTQVIDTEEMLSIKITYEMMNDWEMNQYDLLECAIENIVKNEDIRMDEIGELLADFAGDKVREEIYENGRIPMYVLTNKAGCCGAGVVFAGNEVAELAERLMSDIYIVPSSIHEVLLIPCNSGVEELEINDMIKSINAEVLSPADILSDHVYKYSRTDQLFSM